MDEKIKRLKGLLASVVDANGEIPPSGLTYKNISKIACDRYASQELVTIKIWFYSKGSKSNNKPYSMMDLVPIEVYVSISNDLYDVLTSRGKNYSFLAVEPIEEKEDVYIDPDLVSNYEDRR